MQMTKRRIDVRKHARPHSDTADNLISTCIPSIVNLHSKYGTNQILGQNFTGLATYYAMDSTYAMESPLIQGKCIFGT